MTIGDALGLELSVTNTGDAPFCFEEARHTYFRVGEAESVRVRGLDGVKYPRQHGWGIAGKVQQGDVVFACADGQCLPGYRCGAGAAGSDFEADDRTEKENSATTVV